MMGSALPAHVFNDGIGRFWRFSVAKMSERIGAVAWLQPDAGASVFGVFYPHLDSVQESFGAR